MPDTLQGMGKISPAHNARERKSHQPGLIIASLAHSLLAERDWGNGISLPTQGDQEEGNIPCQSLSKPNILAIFQFVKRRPQWLFKNSARPERIKRGPLCFTACANPGRLLRLATNFAQWFWGQEKFAPAICAPALPEFPTASAAGRKEQVQPAPENVEEGVGQARTYSQIYPPPNTLDSIIRNTAGVISTMKMEGKMNTTIGMSILTGAWCANSSAYWRRRIRIWSA